MLGVTKNAFAPMLCRERVAWSCGGCWKSSERAGNKGEQTATRCDTDLGVSESQVIVLYRDAEPSAALKKQPVELLVVA